jgi:D-mannonate dehydratase
MEGEDNTQPGYMMKGQIFAVGYMHGLIDAVRRRGAPTRAV